MKKIIALLLALTLCCGALASCGETTVDPTQGTTATTVDANKPGVPTIDPNLPVDEGFGLGGETPSPVSLFKYKVLENGTVKITGTYIEEANKLTKLVVPAVIEGKKVSMLGESALATLTNVKEIIVSGYVTEIEAYAFRDCTKLNTLKLPEYVNVIGAGAFSGCTGFSKIDFIPNSVYSLGERVFENCTTTQKIVIPDSVTSIGGYTFVGCSGLTEVVLSKNLDKIPERMFMGCTILGKNIDNFVIAIPEGVTEIGAFAFADCNQVKTITIPSTVTKIGKSAFSGCKRVAELIIPDSVKSIGNEAFDGCSSLKAITLPAGADVKIGSGIINPKNTKKVVITVTNGSAAHTWVTENIGTALQVVVK
jgi:hypothetical protein